MDEKAKALIEKGKGTRFKPGKSGNPKGRPPSWVNQCTKEYRITKGEMLSILNNVLYYRSGFELAELGKAFLSKDNKEPSFLGACAMAIMGDAKRKDWRTVNSMLEWLHGKSTDRDDGSEESSVDVNEFLLFRIQRRLHSGQLKVWHDDSKSQILCMPRRWGKSFLLFSAMVRTCLDPESRCLYVGRSIKEAEKQFSEMKMDWLSRMGLPPGTDLKSIFPATSWIDVFGLSPGTDGTGIRGRKYKLVVYDEFFHLREDYLQFFEDSIISPMQRDFKDWRAIRAGTPPEVAGTLGEEAWNDSLEGKNGWKAFTTHDPDENPNISPFEEWFKEKFPNRQITEPFAQREFFAQWVYDTEALMFPEYHTFDSKESLPPIKITHILIGGDFGHNDDSAVVATAWDEGSKIGYVFFEKTFNFNTTPKGMIVQEYMDKICCECWEKAIDLIGVNNLNRIIWRFDSASPSDIQRLRKNVRARQLGQSSTTINIVGAYKLQSEFMYERMKLLFRTGDLLVQGGGPLEKELKHAIYLRDEITGLITNEIDEKFHPNIIPALRYSLEYVLLAEIGINVNKLSKGRRA